MIKGGSTVGSAVDGFFKSNRVKYKCNKIHDCLEMSPLLDGKVDPLWLTIQVINLFLLDW